MEGHISLTRLLTLGFGWGGGGGVLFTFTLTYYGYEGFVWKFHSANGSAEVIS